jgi:transmembrane sensor
LVENSKHIDFLIARFIAGEASDDEQKELNLWIEASETNRKYFDGISFVANKAVSSHQIIQVDVDNAWQSIHNQIKLGRTKAIDEKKQKVFLLPLWLKVAAMIILVSGISLFLYKQVTEDRSPEINSIEVASSNSVLNYTLADSSTLVLNKNSHITVASGYGQKERRVLLSGEAFFSVNPNPEDPFIVETNNVFIKVTGTSFNIKGNETDSLVYVSVKTGHVNFFSSTNKGIKLTKGEEGVYNKNSGSFTKTIQLNPNVSAYSNRVFIFYNTTLNEVITELTKVYNVKIELENPTLGHYSITVSFNDDDIDTILNIIAETLNLKLSYNNEQYFFEGNECSSAENMSR